MVGKLLRCLLLLGAFGVAMPAAASASMVQQLAPHRADRRCHALPVVGHREALQRNRQRLQWVVIAATRFTAAHCVYTFRSRRFIPATALHFLVGYRPDTMLSMPASPRTKSARFDPLRYGETSDATGPCSSDREPLPAEIAPLRLSQALAPRGTKAVLVGYPQDRAHAMTADRDCELRDEIDGGRFLLHTCRGI
jgi:hypothetical protein